MNWIKLTSMLVLAIFMIVAGTMHFVNAGFFMKIMPPYLPLHKELEILSGVFEILLGVLLLVPRVFTAGGLGDCRFADCRASCRRSDLAFRARRGW